MGPHDVTPPLTADALLRQATRRHRPSHHNVGDGAWSASIEHIWAALGFHGREWPPVEGKTLEENRAALARHAPDFAERASFTYTVLRPGTTTCWGASTPIRRVTGVTMQSRRGET